MAQFASDSFTGTENTELVAYSASWTNGPVATGKMEIAANRIRHNSTTSSIYYHANTPASADYSVSADLYVKSTGISNAPGVAGRMSTSIASFYMARYLADAANLAWELYKAVDNTFTLLGSSAQTLVDETSYNIKLDMVGTAIKLFKESEGTAVISVTDSSVTAAGRAGIRTYSGVAPSDTTGLHLDNFSADDAAASGVLVGPLAGEGGLAGMGGLAGKHGGLAG